MTTSMFHTLPSAPAHARPPAPGLGRGHLQHRPLHERALLALALALVGAALLTSALAALDSRALATAWSQQSVWLKPLKFQLSMALHVATVAWALAWMRGRGLAVPGAAAVAWALCVAVAFEALYITVQGGRGVASHFNRHTPLEAALGFAMAAGAQVLTGVAAWVGGVALWRAARRPLDGATPMLVALGLGFVLAFALAGWSGSLMGQHRGPLPPASLQGLAASVPSLVPLFGWRLDVGDLRPSHFMAVHAMQALPVIAWLCRRLPVAGALTTVVTGAAVWAALAVTLALRALAGHGWL